MTEVITPVVAVKTTPKKSSISLKSKSTKSKPNHPKTSDMVTAAISNLNERSGSSYQAIKKYIVGTYAIDLDRFIPFIKKYLKSAVEQGDIIQTKGKGASGSFKLPKLKSKPKKTPTKLEEIVKKPIAKKSKSISAEKTAVTKKTPAKKAGTTKVKIAVPTKKVTKKIAVKQSPTKKTVKTPTSKPKAPKPKKISTKKTVKTAAK